MGDNLHDIREYETYKELRSLLLKLPAERREAAAEALYEYSTEECKSQFTSPPEVAARLGVTQHTVRNWIRESSGETGWKEMACSYI
ncbi:MAG: helix-turn-helix domain-containing protein [Desulfovibrio sp.]|nr:helix-turn-helix domain-containing protein [Desulfovibrio sp.]